MTVLDDLNIVEVLGDNDRPVSPGDQGRIVITNLFNHTLPILRYELGDYAVRAGYRSDSPFSRIRHLIGRQSENLPVVSIEPTGSRCRFGIFSNSPRSRASLC
jgi:phenylacetate-coenzyme A ligase PaaK-like adenylate-forming protein